MKFIIKKVEIENFRSIQDRVTLNIDEGLYAIVGENLDEQKNGRNGCGKSSIISAIYWCLTGNTLTNEVLADEVINIKVGKGCKVSVYVESDQGEIVITRVRKDPTLGNNLLMRINDQDLTCHKVSDTQDRINQLFKIPFDLLKSTIIMTSDMRSAFSELTPQQRVQVLESIRDYTVWDKVRNQANIDIKSYTKFINEKTNIINEMAGGYKTYSNLMNEAIKQINMITDSQEKLDLKEVEYEFDQKISALEKRITDKNAELMASQSLQLEDLSDYNKKLNDISSTCTKQKENLLNENRETEKRLMDDYTAKVKEIKEIMSALVLQNQDLNFDKKDLIRQQNDIEGWLNKPNCPTCGKPLDRTDEEIADKKATLLKIAEKINKICEEVEKNNNLRDEKEKDLSVLEKNYKNECESTKNLYQEQLKRITEEHKNMSVVISAEYSEKESAQKQAKQIIFSLSQEISSLEKKLSDLKLEKLKKEQEINNKLSEIEKLKDSITKYKAEIDKITAEGKTLRTEIDETVNKCQVSEYFYKLLGPKGDLRPYLLTQSINYVNHKIQNYMNYFFKNTTAKLKLNGPNIDIEIDANGIKKGISSLSSGEAKRVNICIQLSLYDLIQSTSQISFNLLFLDEIENSMDQCGVQQLLNVIEDKADEGISSLFWITNNPEVMQHFDNKIICKKALGRTEIIREGIGS